VTELSLAELAVAPRELADAVNLHEQSLSAFRRDGWYWFALDRDDIPRVAEEREGKPHHLTSTASCFDSLADRAMARRRLESAEDDQTPEKPDWAFLAATFSAKALATEPENWRSEGAAHVYCRVRALPAVLRHAAELTKGQRTAAQRLLTEAWEQVGERDPLEGAIAERRLYIALPGGRVLDRSGQVVKPGGGPHEPTEEEKGQRREERYPPSAFHTYWGVRALEEYRLRGLPEPESIETWTKLARAWSSQTLARQTALILGKAERSDAQQLAYALITDHRLAGDEPLSAGGARHDVYHAALKAFFAAQLPSGTWPLSEPLFHYPESGNAYCYTYETLAELLRPALAREEGRVFRILLKPYLGELLHAWHRAVETRIPLEQRIGTGYGWSSGHHVFRVEAEVWATAAVFSFAQALRCVIGHFAAEAANAVVRIRRSKYPSAAAARDELAKRGDTFSVNGWTVGRRLASLFLHPRTLPDPDSEVMDPDAPIMDTDDARSAILFGPPGTGKTTLVEALAGALGWQFVEVLAADFLAGGVDQVPARADEIFGALMELDRCVVLFDEIDELIRDRSREQTDPFGRFLTTSMLPKIAQLWDQRRVLFFVATNYVNAADAAIRRSSRFDAAILVNTPSLAVKRERLQSKYHLKLPDVDARVSDALNRREKADADVLPFGVLGLLRFDQLAELARRVEAADGAEEQRLKRALTDMAKSLLQNEWAPLPKDNKAYELPEKEETRLSDLFGVYARYVEQERFDQSRRSLIAVPPDVEPPGAGEKRGVVDGRKLVEAPDDLMKLWHANGNPPMKLDASGQFSVQLANGILLDRRLLDFAPPQPDAKH
jgi:predicted ATPase